MATRHFDQAPKTLARLVSLPSPNTVRRLKEALSQPPLRLDPFDTLHLTVCRAYNDQQVMDITDLSSNYSAEEQFPFRFKSFDYVYDDILGTSKILGEVVCPGLEAIRLAYGTPTSYPLTIQFLHSSPPLSRAIKSFVVSIADTLVLKEQDYFVAQGLFLVNETEYQKMFKSHYVGVQGFAPYEER